jgi:hypothetical protein
MYSALLTADTTDVDGGMRGNSTAFYSPLASFIHPRASALEVNVLNADRCDAAIISLFQAGGFNCGFECYVFLGVQPCNNPASWSGVQVCKCAYVHISWIFQTFPTRHLFCFAKCRGQTNSRTWLMALRDALEDVTRPCKCCT